MRLLSSRRFSAAGKEHVKKYGDWRLEGGSPSQGVVKHCSIRAKQFFIIPLSDIAFSTYG